MDTLDPGEHIQSIQKARDRLGDNSSSTLIHRALPPAVTDLTKYGESRNRNLQETGMFQSEPRETLFGTICFQTQIIKHYDIFDEEQKTQTETQTSFIFHPAPWLMRFGLRYGLKAMAIYHHRTWSYTIQPVHAIPDDSLIFTFCRKGNVDAVRELFKRRDASVYDVDTNGWTPLHVSLLLSSLVEVPAKLNIHRSQYTWVILKWQSCWFQRVLTEELIHTVHGQSISII